MSREENAFDVIVIGGGHAGCEAALAAARMGMKVGFYTFSTESIARMSCNPSVGGIAKSHLVCELDVLGGEIGRNADFTGIQFRLLNTSKGPAVRATRAQCDAALYSLRMKAVVENIAGCDLIPGEVTGFIIERGKCLGIQTKNGPAYAKAVVVATGTFLRGRIFVGHRTTTGGRIGEQSAEALCDAMKDIGIKMDRLKTGTPPRLYRDSINFNKTEKQEGENPPPLFSWAGRKMREGVFHVEHSASGIPGFQPPGSRQIPCYLTHTTEATRELVHRNLERSALYGGLIHGPGVRYCPSFEDKVVKFPDKLTHHVFLEPMGLNSDLIYPNGISNSLPEEIQVLMVQSIPGLESAKIATFGYAIEYDFCDPTEVYPTLECKAVDNLFVSGQIMGTTGYEEAAALGFMAGVNASLKAQGKAPFILRRDEAYIGILIDDLVTKGTNEPYRMFTSRAERRLFLRQDNARFRLHDHAAKLGIVSHSFLEETAKFSALITKELDRLTNIRCCGIPLYQILARPQTRYRDLQQADTSLPDEVVEQLEIQVKYAGYLVQEERHTRKMAELDNIKIPETIDYNSIKSLSTEAKEKLSRIRPRTVGQASRIPGITPADITVLVIKIRAHHR